MLNASASGAFCIVIQSKHHNYAIEHCNYSIALLFLQKKALFKMKCQKYCTNKIYIVLLHTKIAKMNNECLIINYLLPDFIFENLHQTLNCFFLERVKSNGGVQETAHNTY